MPCAASATTWSVSPSGSDANLGTAQFPFRTISRAAGVARSGDTVLVADGRYTETVNLYDRNSGVVFRGTGESRPVVDGGGYRSYGFHNSGADQVTIENFEITKQTDVGIYTEGSGVTITRNLLHHIGSAAESTSGGVQVVRGSANSVSENTVHHVGPGRFSVGIWLIETRDARVEDNSIYFVRKEGIRDWKGLDNVVTGNRSFLNWVGIALNTSTGSTVTDNHVYDTVEGFAVKHASYETVLDYWNLDAAHWSRLQHNTVDRSSEASIWIAQSDEPLDYVEVRDNRVAGAGAAFLRDIPSLRGPHVTVDANEYSNESGAPNWLYKAGWGSGDGLSDWAAVRQETGWETSDPPADAGARTGGSAPATWTRFAMTPVNSSSKDTYYTRNHLPATADDDQSSYWVTETNRDEYVVFDFGQPRTINHLILTLYSDEDKRNPRGYRIAVSDDGSSWRTVKSGTNQDASQAARYYELKEPATARFLRFTMVDTFCTTYVPRLGCGKYFVLSDLEAGFLAGAPAMGGDPSSQQASLARVTLGRSAVLTQAGELRLRVTCVGSVRETRFAVTRRTRRLGRKRVALQRGCSRSVDVPLRRRFAKRLRWGGMRTVRVTTRTADGHRVTRRLRVRT